MWGVTESRSVRGSKQIKKQNCGAPYLLILHNSGCRRIKVSLIDTNSVKNARNCMNSVHRGEGRGRPFKFAKMYSTDKTCEILCVKPQSQELQHAYE
jgi:hypothetical protein